MILIATFVLLCQLSLGEDGSPSGSTAAADAAPGIDGEWTCTRSELGGRETEEVLFHKIIISGKLGVEVLPNGKAIERTINTGVTPDGYGTIDILGANEVVRKGIFRITGKTLELCIGSPRPTDFSTKPGDRRELYHLSRAK